ncbi:MAG: hypothetical protein JWP33_423 [Blastococcus sp.]|nr:hypothetical protein [Blastococcus sp.]
MSVIDLGVDVVGVDEARNTVPALPGLYARWSLPGITGPRDPDGEHELMYVGIARSGPSSRATLRSRVVGNHMRGTTGQSTLRRSLAALLQEREGWRSRFTDRPLLLPADELRLDDWMQQHLALTWTVHDQPWTVEAQVIAELTPPLNQSANSWHPLYPLLRDARNRWRKAAQEAGEKSEE